MPVSVRKERSDAVLRRVYELQITHNPDPTSTGGSSSSSTSCAWQTHCDVEQVRSIAVRVAHVEFPSDATLDALRSDDERVQLVQSLVAQLTALPAVQRSAEWLALLDVSSNMVAVLESDARMRDRLNARLRELEAASMRSSAPVAAAAPPGRTSSAVPVAAVSVAAVASSSGTSASTSLPSSLQAEELSAALERLAAVQARCEALESHSSGLARQLDVLRRDKTRQREAVRSSRDFVATVGRGEVRYSETNEAYTMYCIEVSLAGTTFEQFRRFREFSSLHARLLQLFPELPIPVLPPKSSLIMSVFKGQAASQLPKVIDDRRHALAEYVGALCQLPLVRDSVDFQTFLGLHLHVVRVLKAYDDEFKSAQVVAADAQLAAVDRFTLQLTASNATLERERSAVKAMRTLALGAHRSAARRLASALDALHEDVDVQLDAVAAGDATLDSVRDLCDAQFAALKLSVEEQRMACDDTLTLK